MPLLQPTSHDRQGFAAGTQKPAATAKWRPVEYDIILDGQGGIRTHGTVSGTPVFETGSFNRSDTCPTLPLNRRSL